MGARSQKLSKVSHPQKGFQSRLFPSSVLKMGMKQKRVAIDRENLERFLREKVEKERLTDQEIAQILHVGITTVFYWRRKFHIPRADKFERKFKERYGEDAVTIFQDMVERGATLQEIGDLFGFTREYARQVYRKLYPSDKWRRRKKHRSSPVGGG